MLNIVSVENIVKTKMIFNLNVKKFKGPFIMHDL